MKKETVIKFYFTYRLYIFPAIVALSSLILILLIIVPQLSTLISNQKTEKELIDKSKFLEVKAQTLDSYDSGDLSNKVSHTLASFPQDKDFGNVIGLIQNLVSQSGFIVTTMTMGASGNKITNSQSYNIQLQITGPKNLISALLSNIESSIRLMRVGSIEIINTADQQVVNIALDLDILYASIPTSFGSIDSTLPELSQKDQELLAKLASNAVTSSVSSSGVNVILPPRGKANPFE